MNNKKLLKWANTRLQKDLIYPSISEILQKSKKLGIDFKNRFHVRKWRNNLPAIAKFEKTGLVYKKRHFIPSRANQVGWVQFDLGFMTFQKKNYGKFAIAIDCLSKYTYVQTIPNKSFASIKQFFLDLSTQPGFRYMRRVLSDEESALSRKNRDILEALLNNVRFFRTKRKAALVERRIRTFKLYISKSLLSHKEQYTQWRNHISRVLYKLNNTPLPKTNLRPVDFNLRTAAKYVTQMMNDNPHYKINLYGIGLPTKEAILEKNFKFNIGDVVYMIKPKYYDVSVQNKYKFETKSIAGHLDLKSKPFKVQHRFLSSSKLFIFPLYDIKMIDSTVFVKSVYEEYIRHVN